MSEVNPDLTCRLDVWLFRTRLCKTRTEAQSIINKGRLRLTRAGETSRVKKPHYQVRPGDRISFMRHRALSDVEVVAPGTRRGPASEAQTLYIDLQDSHNLRDIRDLQNRD